MKSKSLFYALLLTLIIGMPNVVATTPYIAKISSNDTWSFTDNVSYKAIKSYNGRPDYAPDAFITSFQTEVNSTDKPFLNSFYYSDNEQSVNISMTNYDVEHRLVSQRGVFYLLEMGKVDLSVSIKGNFTSGKADHVYYYYKNWTQLNLGYKNYSYYCNDYFQNNQDPSVVIVTGQPLELHFEWSSQNNTSDYTPKPGDESYVVFIGFLVKYVPSDPYYTDYNGVSTKVVNVTSELYLTEAYAGSMFKRDDFGRDVAPNDSVRFFFNKEFSHPILMSKLSRVFSYDIGLPIKEVGTTTSTVNSSQSLSLYQLSEKTGTVMNKVDRELKSFSVKDSRFFESVSKKMPLSFLSFLVLIPLMETVRRKYRK